MLDEPLSFFWAQNDRPLALQQRQKYVGARHLDRRVLGKPLEKSVEGVDSGWVGVDFAYEELEVNG